MHFLLRLESCISAHDLILSKSGRQHQHAIPRHEAQCRESLDLELRWQAEGAELWDLPMRPVMGYEVTSVLSIEGSTFLRPLLQTDPVLGNYRL